MGYWVTAGDFEQGEVLDVTEIANAAAVVFPPGVFAMTAVLGANNTWTVSPGLS